MSSKDLFLIRLARQGIRNPEYAQKILPFLREAADEFSKSNLKTELKKLKKEFSPFLTEEPDMKIPDIDFPDMAKTARKKKAYRSGGKKIDKWAYFQAKEYLKESNKLSKEYKKKLDQLKIELLEDLGKNEEEASGEMEDKEEGKYKGDETPKEKAKRKKAVLKELNKPLKQKYKLNWNQLKNEHSGKQKDLYNEYKKRHPQFSVALSMTKGNKFFGRVFLGIFFLMFLRIILAI